MSRSPPPPPSAQSTSPRPKESSFLKLVGKELSAFGFGSSSNSGSSGASKKSTTPSAKGSALQVKSPQLESRRSHRPAPKAPGEVREGSFPGVKLRSRETLMPPAESSGSDLNQEDFDDLAGETRPGQPAFVCGLI